jgi:hypothetical protein
MRDTGEAAALRQLYDPAEAAHGVFLEDVKEGKISP